jgi:hypothetical protein
LEKNSYQCIGWQPAARAMGERPSDLPVTQTSHQVSAPMHFVFQVSGLRPLLLYTSNPPQPKKQLRCSCMAHGAAVSFGSQQNLPKDEPTVSNASITVGCFRASSHESSGDVRVQ